MALAARARDFFLLRQASEEAGRRPAERRDAVGQALALGRQRAEAAEALWSNGHAAEGLRLAAESLTCTLGAADILAPEVKPAPVAKPAPEPATKADADSEDEASTEADSEADSLDEAAPQAASWVGWREVLAARGADADRLETISRAVGFARQALPELDASVSATHAELYKEIYRARADVDGLLSSASLTPAQVKLKVVQRWATLLGLAVLAVVGLYLALRTPHAVMATSSAVFRSDPQFGPDKVFDDDPNTEWLLNDGQNGWLEARLTPGRDLVAIRLLNGHNRHFNDRGVKEFTLELYDRSGEKVFEHEGELEFSASPTWVEIPVSATNVERLRFNVRSHHRVGGALAEIALDER
ncbi:MAG: hypothetical protein KC586_24405 [Myxococcales bacterium]|nr:hypothetical protein [Myxococcales bacterium]